ncbi:DUF2156 domain-containing protein [Clostridium bovifaecis]|uniref:DUF2156 domain-containing protein n=1 Tax=Clostridium bovifaecis TaxID=2184719 RepID=A0A6I6F777_9CLOT|nr:DUF2156 domain-containing protein [Clostridium bovifaecis]
MLTFNPLTIKDKHILDKYLQDYKFTTSEYSFTNLLIWRKACDVQYAIYKDILIIKKKDFKENYHFMQPIGYNKENLKELVEKLKEYKKENNMKYLFKDVENSFLEDLKDIFGDEAHIKEDVDNFDYIYLKDKLISLSGKKLHGKKNHYNYFIKNYNYSIKDLSEPGVKEDCIQLAQKWHIENYTDDMYLTYELDGIIEVLNYANILNLKGMAVYVDDIIASFTIGELVNDDMAIVHFEKGLKDINGIYAFTNKTFVERYLNKVEYINREQDLGIEGLRKAKKSYHPIKLEEKYCVNL